MAALKATEKTTKSASDQLAALARLLARQAALDVVAENTRAKKLPALRPNQGAPK